MYLLCRGRQIDADERTHSELKHWPPVIRAFGLTAGATASGVFLAFVRSAAMARILSPDAFGLFGIATMASAGIQVLADFGLKSILIARVNPQDPKSQAWTDTIWTMELLRGCVAACAMALFADDIGAFFNEPDAYRLIYVLAFATAITGFVNTGLFLLERRLEFGRVVLVEQIAAVVSLAVAIGLGLWLRTAHALAWAAVASAITTVFLSFALVPTRPTIRLDPSVAREAARAGASLLVIGVLTFLTTQFDNAVIGRVSGTEVLGIYLAAYTLAMLPVNIVATVVNRVMLPDYAARVHFDQELALAYWAHVMRASAWLLLCFVMPMWLFGDFVITMVYGDRWILAGPVLSILAFVAFARGLARANGPMLLALGRQDVDAKAKLVETVFFIGLVLALVGSLEWGMIGAAWAGLASYGMAAISRTIFLAQRSPQATRILVAGIIRMAVVCVAVALVSSTLKNSWLHEAGAVVAVSACIILAAFISEPQARAIITGLRTSPSIKGDYASRP